VRIRYIIQITNLFECYFSLGASLSKSYLSLRFEAMLLSGVLVQGVQLKAEALVYSTNPSIDYTLTAVVLQDIVIAVERVALL
jgi:hypothetical protein